METLLAAVIGIGAVAFLTTFFVALCRESRRGPRRAVSVVESWNEQELGSMEPETRPSAADSTTQRRRVGPPHHARVA
jgi:hypothetical protein